MSERQQIDISQLPLPQLNQFSQQLEQEIELFTASLNQLKMAQGKFAESQECLGRLTPPVNEDILVPLTSSMYVPGHMCDTGRVLIDVGTGYFVHMSVAAAKDYFKRKVDYLTRQIEKVQPLLQEKYKMKQVTMEMLQMKIHAQQQQQQQQGSSSSSNSAAALAK